MSENKNLGHNSKKDFLNKPVEHIDITSFDSRKIISSMEKMSFVSRETANAANIYNKSLLYPYTVKYYEIQKLVLTLSSTPEPFCNLNRKTERI